jgi:hypothetical protein
VHRGCDAAHFYGLDVGALNGAAAMQCQQAGNAADGSRS